MPYFHAPAVGRVTSPYGPRRPYFHRGIDIAPPRPGQTGQPVFAAYAGTVRATRSGGGSSNPITGTWNSGSYILIDGPGGGSEWYGHVVNIRVKAGDKVKAGQRIADMGAVGNVTGIHLHFECWNGRSQGGGADGPGSTRDPALDFAKYGITPGQAGSGGKTPVSNSRPTRPTSSHVLSNDAVRSRVRAALPRPSDGLLSTWVRQWQQRQLYKPGLIADGVWGPASEAHYQWTLMLQRTMAGWKGNLTTAIDGDYHNATRARVREIQRRNHGGAYRGVLDSIPGPVFCRMLGIPTHPGL